MGCTSSEHKLEYNAKYRVQNSKTIKAWASEYRKINRESINEKFRERRAQTKDWYNKNIDAIHCNDCGTPFRGISGFAEFHHITKDKNNIPPSQALQQGYIKLCVELNKGVFLCPNCHTIRHLHLKEKISCLN